MTEQSILTVYRYAFPFHYHWIMRNKWLLWNLKQKRWKCSNFLFLGMKTNHAPRQTIKV